MKEGERREGRRILEGAGTKGERWLNRRRVGSAEERWLNCCGPSCDAVAPGSNPTPTQRTANSVRL
jgi:hypothetical protein